MAIAGDAAAEATLRGRATGALAHAASPRARTFLMDVVTRAADDRTPPSALVLRRAAVALGWQGGPTAPPPLGALLAHADPEVRTDAAVGLGLTRLAPAASLLRNHLAVEKDARVRGARQPPAEHHRGQPGPGRRPPPGRHRRARGRRHPPPRRPPICPAPAPDAAARPRCRPPGCSQTAPGSSGARQLSRARNTVREPTPAVTRVLTCARPFQTEGDRTCQRRSSPFSWAVDPPPASTA